MAFVSFTRRIPSRVFQWVFQVFQKVRLHLAVKAHLLNQGGMQLVQCSILSKVDPSVTMATNLRGLPGWVAPATEAPTSKPKP